MKPDCDWRRLDDRIRCARCKKEIAWTNPILPRRNCNGPPGWGDRFARRLARGHVVPFVKITPESYRRWKVRWGLADDCDCPARQEKLNRFGRWISALRRRLSAWIVNKRSG